MAARSRRSAAADVVDEAPAEADPDAPTRLRFKQPLVGRPGKQIGVGDLLARLKALCDELRNLEQEEADRESLEPVAKDLAHQSLLHHKDGGVRAWTACCVVDMFRLCAPDAPYTASQLKDIFTLIVAKIFPLLADPSNPYNGQHLYVLKCLAEVKSIVLLTDIPGSGQLTATLFRTCFDVLSGPSKATNGEELSKNVEHHMTSVLTILVEESPALSSDVVDTIVAQFLWADPAALGVAKGKKNAPLDTKQSTLLRNSAPPAYNMAKNLCNACPDKMARLVSTYFSSVIVDFSGTAVASYRSRAKAGSHGDDSEDEGAKGTSEEDLNDAIKAHRLLRELWRCAPGVLQDIIPNMQEELGTDNIQLRQLATETFGDMISGIGAAGPPPRPVLNPAAYPSQSLAPPEPRPYNFLTTPTSPNSFPSQHAGAYHAFLQRKYDKSPIIRASWATGVGRILMTSAGGVGLDSEEEQRLLNSFAESLIDSDERVRIAAIRAIDSFEFHDIVNKLGRNGTMSEPGSILFNLAQRVKDKKGGVIHSESMKLLGRIWGVAAGAIAAGNERITSLLGPIPSNILEAVYVNDNEISILVDLTLHDALLPLGYPPMKPKAATNGASQVVKDSQTNGDQGYTEAELDKIRVERELVLVKGLSEKARKVFFVKQVNQASGSQIMEHFLKLCEENNGGVVDKGKKVDIKTKLEGLMSYYAKMFPDQARAVGDLRKFAEAHDRRNYQLIRFCMSPESDYRKIFKSIKELRKRLEDGPLGSILETIIPLLYRSSLLCYNKSHVPAIIEYSRTDEGGLGATAHDVLKEISTSHPKVFSIHVKDLCKALESEAPTADSPNPPGAVEDLKACAGFAKKFPDELHLNSKDNRKLVQTLMDFALYGSPKAAKHAITIIMNCDNRKEMRVKDILAKSIKGFEYGCDHFLTKLAAIAQLVLLAPEQCEDDADDITDIAVTRVLLKAHTTSPQAELEWMETPDEDMIARTLAFKILVNRLRSFPSQNDIAPLATPIYTMFNRLVKEGGEASKKGNTPLGHKNLQRLLASQYLLKLSRVRRLDSLFGPAEFNELALVTHDASVEVRQRFATTLMKYLGKNMLPNRFYTLFFYYAFEPETRIVETVTTLVKSRRSIFAARKDTTLETIFARLLSLLAHHPDFDNDNETLRIMAKYILFYLKCVATPDNLSLIFHVAQRVKGIADGITSTTQASENLYVLSDLSQALIRIWEEQNNWSMQSWPGKLKFPAGIFKPLENHERAQEIAEKVWVDEDLVESLDSLVKETLRTKKRKATDGGEKKQRKKPKAEKTEKKEKAPKAEKPAKTPKQKKRKSGASDDEDETGSVPPASSEPRRKSDRRSGVNTSYVEVSTEDEADVEAGAQEGNEGAEDSEAEMPNGDGESANGEVEEDVEMGEADADADAESNAAEEQQQEQEAESEPEPEPASEPEPEPEPTPKKAVGRPKASKKANGTTSTPTAPTTTPRGKRKATKIPTPSSSKSSKPSPPAKPASASDMAKLKALKKTKPKPTSSSDALTASSPAAPANTTGTRRSARSRG